VTERTNRQNSNKIGCLDEKKNKGKKERKSVGERERERERDRKIET
jgi:hypothetical protein